jgi:cytochrome P450
VDDLHPWMPALAEDPYPWYRELREHDPVHYSPSLDAWFVARYDDVVRVLRSPEEFSSSAILAPRGEIRGPLGGTVPGGSAAGARAGANGGADGGANGAGGGALMGARPDASRFLLTADPPDHTKLRRLVSRPFTPSAIAALEPHVRAVTEQLVDDLILASTRGEADLIAHLGGPLPLLVIAHMLGIDAEHGADFREWSGAMTLDSPGEFGRTMRPGMMFKMMGYLSEAIEARRAEPRDDIISMLVAGNEPLDAQELLMFTVLLLIAGNETTTSLIGNGMLALWSNPEQLARLADDPSLVPACLEEVLRYDPPVQALSRQTTTAVDFGDVTIPEGERVYVLYASANRDAAHFDDPEQFLIDRAPGDHIAFGSGIHFCLGAALARLEGQVAAETLVARVRTITPAGAIVRKPTPSHAGPALLRGVARLPVHIEAT